METVDIISLGCSKNLVDSEALMTQLKAAGMEVHHDPKRPTGKTVVINTCGFIGDAKEESIDTILQFAEAKKRGKIDRLLVMGCLSERYAPELKEALPEVDKFYGKFKWQDIVTDLGHGFRRDLLTERSLTTPKHYAYLKISEGCNRFCSYCAIPLITGRHTSRPMEELIEEAEKLCDKGVRELQIIAQDLSSYGLDLYKESKLAELTQKLSEIEGIDWIRLHYAYPADFPMDILPVIANNPKVCCYLDLALQHISDNMLSLMRRHITKEKTLSLLKSIRTQVPGIHIRTTLITGHPGETEEDFRELVEFVREARFERLGVFPYSHEEDTYAYKHYEDNIPDEVKQARAEEIMALQSEISHEIQSSKIGTVLNVIIDRKEGDNFIGRTEYDSPEVDPEVIIPATSENKKLVKIGKILPVKIVSAEDYDLFAEPVK
ncbi:MAG: 30S ribosomal protein S12 methylthiotransferase RimO [Bacteroidales bacterium]|nr:30S ribosomal protein S12 methylthiotransferase RimO [Bacteroidales bacterium]